MEKTVEVTSIPFTDKEYVKALETLLNQSIDFIAEKLNEELISDGYISLQNKDLTWKEIQAKCVVTEAAARTAWKIVNEVPYRISENKSMYSVRYNYYASSF